MVEISGENLRGKAFRFGIFRNSIPTTLGVLVALDRQQKFADGRFGGTARIGGAEETGRTTTVLVRLSIRTLAMLRVKVWL
jgi:hypothetical protein